MTLVLKSREAEAQILRGLTEAVDASLQMGVTVVTAE